MYIPTIHMKFMYTIPWFGTNHKKAVHTKLKKTNSESNCIKYLSGRTIQLYVYVLNLSTEYGRKLNRQYNSEKFTDLKKLI